MNDTMRAAEAIAVVGAACRLPGGITTLEALWSALVAGRDLVSEAPPERFDRDLFYAADPRRPGKSYTFAGGFLDDIAGWDAEFFGFSPREACRIDPQQRLLLEMAVDAIDDAGMQRASLAGSDTGVYVGCYELGYGSLQARDPASIDVSTMCGTLGMGVANRLSYFLDLRGPSIVVDTACSSSLVAIHQACDHLRLDRSRVALAGGINALVDPYSFVTIAKGQALSRRGRCQAFSADADGFVRAEGGGLVVLKRLGDALADGDRVHAVIVGSGTNCDGRTIGLAHPSTEAQEALLRQVYESAGIAPDEVAYFEAHGTGTQAGDAAECAAIGRALGMRRRAAGGLPMGSVKTNIGHLEAAAGIAGLLKAILVLKHGEIPPSLHAETLNPDIDFCELRLEPTRERRPLRPAGRAVAGINSFGIGGANAHVILEESTRQEVLHPRVVEAPLPIVVSGRTEAAVRHAAADMAGRLDGMEPAEFYDVAYTACRRRGLHPHRAAVLALTPGQAAERLRAVARNEPAAVGACLPAARAGRVGFVFSGNGSQWAGMAAELLRDSPVFRTALEKADASLRPRLGWSVIDELRAPVERSGLARTEVAQPVLFAVQAGLVAVLADLGVRPALVAGHSVGEVAAAYACGAYDIDDAAWVIAERSLAQAGTAGQGRMAAVGLSAPAAERELAAFGGRLELAAVNSESDVTISGDEQALYGLGERLAGRQVFFRMLDLDYAFHSRSMDLIEEPLLQALAGLTPSQPRIPMVSTVTGSTIDGTELGAGYWWRNVREPVLLTAVVRQMDLAGCDVLVEIGPHPVLAGYLRRLAPEAVVVPTLSRADRRQVAPGAAEMEVATAQVIAAGGEMDWARFFPRPGRVVSLPAYPWQREKHWNGAPEWWSGRLDHPLLGRRADLLEPTWHGEVEPVRVPWLADHKVGEAVVVPATAHVEMALAAGRRLFDAPCEITDLDGLRALVLPWDDPEMDVRLQASLSDEDGLLRIASRSGAAGTWQVHARTRVRRLLREAPAARGRSDGSRWDAEEFYARARSIGLPYGPAFRVLRALHVGEREVVAEYAVNLPTDAYEVHPALLDGGLQAGLPLLGALERGQPFLPAGIGAVRMWRRPPARGLLHVCLRAKDGDEGVIDFTVSDDDGVVALEVEGCRLRRFEMTNTSVTHYSTVLRAAPRPGTAADGTPLPAPRALLEAAGDQMSRLADQWRRHDYDSLTTRVAEYHAHLAAQALAEIVPGRPFSVADVIASGALPKYRKLIDMLAAMAHAAGLLEPVDPDRWSARAQPAPQPLFEALLSDFPEAGAALLLFGRSGQRLAAALRGEADPMELIFSTADAHLVELYYAHWPAYRANVGRAIALAEALAERWPRDRALRVLEVGAGTGAVTARLLPHLPPERTRYLFTDVSQAFLARARARFASYDFVSYAALDLDRGLGEQGFGAGDFDLVVAGSVLHAAADLRAALGRVGSLLAPGGYLLALETHDPQTLAACFGLLDSFWSFTDAPLRTTSMLLPARQWPQVLEECSFEEIVHIDDGADPVRDSVLLARRSGAAVAAVAAPTAAGSWTIVSEQGQARLGEAVASRLTESGADVRMVEQTAEAAPWTRSQNIVLLLGADPEPAGDEVDQAVGRAALLRAIAKACGDGTAVWLVTRPSGALPAPESPLEPVDAAAWAMARTVASEHSTLTVRRISMQRGQDITADARRLVAELVDPQDEDEILLTPGGRFVPRVVKSPPATVADKEAAGRTAFALRLRDPGPSHRLEWAQVPPIKPGPDEVLIAVRAAALNYRDVLQALGTMEPQTATGQGHPIGYECAGVVEAVGDDVITYLPGDRVYALGTRATASHMVTNKAFVGRIPDGMHFAEAATLPLAFLTVHHSLRHLARLAPGELLLIHGAAGGVGLAALQYARLTGAEVIATAGTPAKHDLLRMLGVRHVFNSRDLNFAEQVRDVTDGPGVDVVLNSVAGEGMRRGLELLRPGGRFIELGKRDAASDARLPLRPFLSNLTFSSVDEFQMLFERTQEAGDLFAEVADLVTRGIYRPLPHSRYAAARAQDAYRAMQHSRHIGKLVLDLDDPPPMFERPARVPAFDAGATYLVTGGLSGLGAASARWLAEHGAGHLALAGRRGIATPGGAALIEELRERGSQVTAYAVDVTDRDAMRGLVSGIDASGHPLRGVVHAAVHFDDARLVESSDERLAAVLAPKMRGALILDDLTRDHELDLFVVYSSITALVGNREQTAYSAANMFLEALVRARRHAGRPGLAVAWPVIDDSGYVAREHLTEPLIGLGFGHYGAARAVAALADLLDRDADVATVATPDWARLAAMFPLVDTPRFAGVRPAERDDGGVRPDLTRAELARVAAQRPEDAERLVQDALAELIAQVLQTQPERLNRDHRLDQLGVDSLTATEVMVAVRRQFSCDLSIVEILSAAIPEQARRLLTRIRS